ncbi:pyroglutamylated RF-amide peptide receptor [Bacillus rossius redtenbacheri]|uniref:pyroglutamylated RF-amide peptide receptor n=1 Tax=Bacillus rossius redtenbacheri TaxID=93214 RepID=UPI002FDE54CB
MHVSVLVRRDDGRYLEPSRALIRSAQSRRGGPTKPRPAAGGGAGPSMAAAGQREDASSGRRQINNGVTLYRVPCLVTAPATSLCPPTPSPWRRAREGVEAAQGRTPPARAPLGVATLSSKLPAGGAQMADTDYFDLRPSGQTPLEEHAPNRSADWSCVTDNDTFPVPESSLLRMPASVNLSFVVVYLLLLGVAVVANGLTICVTYRGKHRLLYRCCLISLACSDLVIAVCAGLSHFPKFLQAAHNYWVMGEFLCYFLPFLQTATVLANSMTLSCIAVDRYLVVTQAARTYWDPSGFACVACVLTIWTASAGVAFPMYGHYMWMTAAVGGEDGRPCYLFHMCALTSKDVKNKYFIAVFTIIFLPLLCTFIVLYCLVMRFLWTRKRPGAAKPFIGDPKGAAAQPGRDSRKTRTVKAILALMLTFVCLRMPSWVFLLYASGPARQLVGLGWWLAQNVCSALVVANSAVNPFFYCFLGRVLGAWDALRRRLAGEAPSAPPPEAVPAEGGKAAHTMVPRGPYSVQQPGEEAALPAKPGSSTVTSSVSGSPRLAGSPR